MASPNIVAMMVEKGAPYSVEELQRMDDRECWKWVYKNQPPKSHKPRDNRPEICFTGFRPDERQKLEDIADRVGYRVVKSVTSKLSTLVTGEAPGPSKLEKAHQQAVEIMDRDQFISSIEEKLKATE
ncbi:MAG: BRCT domain-containing protein [Syntrophaceae bacterium]